MPRGGRRSPTWKPSWNLGKTKVIRIPEAIADTIYEIARKIDSGELDPNCLVTDKSNNNIADFQAKKETGIETKKDNKDHIALNNLEFLGDKYLKTLKLGKQARAYKERRKFVEEFLGFLLKSQT